MALSETQNTMLDSGNRDDASVFTSQNVTLNVQVMPPPAAPQEVQVTTLDLDEDDDCDCACDDCRRETIHTIHMSPVVPEPNPVLQTLTGVRDLLTIALLIPLILLACRGCTEVAKAQNALLMPAAKAEELRTYLPQVDDEDLQAILRDKATIFYTDEEMPRVVSMWQGVDGVSRRIVAAEDGSDPGSLQFPWMHPGGTDNVRGLRTVRFLHLPHSPTNNGQRWPIVWFRGYIPPDSAPAVQWIFPTGTTIGEVLAMPGPDGYDYPFELRVRYRYRDAWEADAFRPFTSPQQLADAIKRRRPGWSLAPNLAQAVRTLEGPTQLGTVTLDDRQPVRQIIRQTAGFDAVPDLQDPKLVAELLRGTPFTSAQGQVWRMDANGKAAYAPGSLVAFNIVPAGYAGSALKVEAQSCARCHETTLRHVNEFAQHQRRYADGTQRFWYGRVRGSDGIFSFHPFDARMIPGNGATVQPVLRRELLDAGVLERYDPERHPADVYKMLEAYDPRRDATSPAMNVIQAGY